VDYESEAVVRDYAAMIQQFNRFLLDQFSVEGDMQPKNPRVFLPPETEAQHDSGIVAPPITQLLGIDAKSVIACSVCQAVLIKGGMSHVVDLVYPRKVRLSHCLWCAGV
jgi:PAB-dependent poly(A)-specific ribonuclease subunit 2